VVFAIAAAGAGAWYAWKRTTEHRSAAASDAVPSIAVLPFKDLSPNHDQEYFSDGISEEILSALSGVKGLRVPGRVSSFYFKGRNVEPGEIARKLGVAHLLEGSVRRSGNKLRISAEVVRANDGERVWSKSFDRDLSDVFAVQDEIARTVADALRLKLVPGEDLQARWTKTDKPEAYNELLLARDFMRRGTPEDYRRALEAYERALALDPRYAAAWVGVADSAGSLLGSGLEDPVLRRKAVAAADEAVVMAPDHPNAYRNRAVVRQYLLFDWPGAVADLDRALALNPEDAGARWDRGALLGAPETFKGQISRLRFAADGDPLNANAWTELGEAYLAEDDLLHARQALGRALEISPGHSVATRRMSIWLLAGGRPGEALALAAKSPMEWFRLTTTALAQNDLGNVQESNAALDALVARHASNAAAQVAEVHAWRGDRDKAFEWLERAHAQRDPGLMFAIYNPLFRKLHDDPRWKEFLRRMTVTGGRGLPEARPAEASHATPSIAVLPFADMSPKHDQEYFADGVAEEILNALTQIQGLKVIGRTSSFSFKGKSEDLRTIGQKLGVGTLLEGSVRKDGGRVRVTAQLVRSTDGSHLWSQTFDRDLSGVFAIQEEIARSVVEALRVKLLPGATVARQGTTANWEANQHYILGRDFFRALGLENVRRAEAEYEQAVVVDPNFGLAWASLAHAIVALEAIDPPSGSATRRGRAALAANRAIALAPNLPNGYVARGRIRRSFERDWSGAHSDFQRAHALAPGDASAAAFAGVGWMTLGVTDKAIPLNEKATELDPLWGYGWNLLGIARLHAGQVAKAREAFSRAIELTPRGQEPRLGLCQTLLYERKPEEALKVVEGSEDPWVRYTCTAMARHDLGQARESQAALDALVSARGEGEAYAIATVYAWRGETDRAFDWLARASGKPVGGLYWASTDPALRSLHADPRWKALLKKLNLPVD
jgi:TolB-like protein/Tfp pilus assembly protein PilF